MSTQYFITGGFGLIGSQLVNSISASASITVLSRSNNNAERVTRKDVRVLNKNVADIVPEDLTGMDVVYHLASTVDNYNVLSDPYIDMETNIRGTIALLESCRNLEKKPKIIYLSTFFVYGNQYEKQNRPVNEGDPTDPLALYPATKLCAESTIKLYSKLYGIPYTICRLTNVYGEHESFSNKKKGALNYLIMQSVKGETLSVYKGGNFYRDYIYVDDVVSALQFLEARAEARNETFLVGSGKPVLFKEMIDYIHELTGKRSVIQEIEPPEFHAVVGIRNFIADVSKIESLGWHSKIEYKEGIKRIVERYKNIAKGEQPA